MVVVLLIRPECPKHHYLIRCWYACIKKRRQHGFDHRQRRQTCQGWRISPPLQGYAKKVLDGGWIKPDKRIFNSAKVTDHFAIIPTGKEPESLPPDEAALHKMVAQRFVAIFYPAAEYQYTERITKIEADHFKSRGRVVLPQTPALTISRSSSQERGVLAAVG